MSQIASIVSLLVNDGINSPTTVGQLKLWDKIVGLDVRTGDVEQEFLNDPGLPGFIVHAERQIFGVLSRRMLLTAIAQPFGREVFIKRPLQELAHKMDTRPLTLKGSTPIADALKQSMRRPEDMRFEPILVHTGTSIGLLEMHMLMIAQANLLEDALSSKGVLIERIKGILGGRVA